MAPMGFRIITRLKVVITSLKVVITNSKVVTTNIKVVITILLLKFFFLLMAPIELRRITGTKLLVCRFNLYSFKL